MKDIQNLHDSRQIDIRKVGVKNISYPITVLDKSRKTQETVASVNMYVNLPHRFKGTHMSRFIEILNQFHGQFNLETLHLILQEMKKRLEAEAAHFEIAFPYFFKPQYQATAFQSHRYDCRLHGSLEQQLDLIVEVDVPVLLSAAKYNTLGGLWGNVSVSVRLGHFVWIEDLILLVEKGAAESDINMDTPEDVCKKISDCFVNDRAFSWYRVVVENIAHGYTTSASIEGP